MLFFQFTQGNDAIILYPTCAMAPSDVEMYPPNTYKIPAHSSRGSSSRRTPTPITTHHIYQRWKSFFLHATFFTTLRLGFLCLKYTTTHRITLYKIYTGTLENVGLSLNFGLLRLISICIIFSPPLRRLSFGTCFL